MGNAKKYYPYLLWMVCFFIVISPMFSGGIWAGFDWQAHTLRFTALKHSLEHSQIPPTFDYWTDTQYAYPWQIFYAPLSSIYFIFSILTLHGFSSETQLKFSIMLIMLTGALTSFFVGKKYHQDTDSGIFVSILFISTGYVLSNVYIRFSLGELLAVSLTPLFIYGVICLFKNTNGKWWLTISSILIALSNIPLFICSFVFFVIITLTNLKKVASLNHIKFYTYSLILFAGATCFYWLPLAYQSSMTGIYAFTGLKNSYVYMHQVSAEVIDVLLPITTSSGSSVGKILCINTVSLIICMYLFFCKKTNSTENKLFLASIIAVFAATNLFPWFLIPESFPVLGAIQFPWRMIGLSIFGLCLISGKLASNNKYILWILIALSMTQAFHPLKKASNEEFKFQNSMLYIDYMNKTASLEGLNYLKQRENRMKLISQKPEKFSNGYPVFFNKSEKSLTLPFLWYYGYYIKVNGNTKPVEQDEHGLVKVDNLPSNSVIEIKYDTWLINLSYIISFLTIILFVAFRIKAPK
ncbi:hypothetical protein [Enterobacter hormaechei]|uniref:hypothetical protein n=1 Tax=Enterobacter hormaechei TaxID=158836 RepID=UPI000C1F4AF8|nr:hypothetical protein [Enterobacter hormaechei]HBL5344032.1 hypothetical protein [Enterobacter hormaechei]HBL9046885.1 hypothetical protein [Enterobacter hormaechei]HBL9057012.1 hypothetical protein [Enterobacter hormaechei]HBL9071224.1 hypothetical protein [Enterobacter hormaechei]